MRHTTIIRTLKCVIGLVLCAGLIGIGIASADSTIAVSSSAIAAGASIPSEFTCSGADDSPPIEWSGAPASTRSIALIVDDPDAPRGTWVHWVLYDLPAGTSRLDESVPKTPELIGGGVQGMNDFGKVGYNGPCPPPGRPHHYHFRVFALDTKLDLKPGANAAALRAAMRGHVLASGELIGIFSR